MKILIISISLLLFKFSASAQIKYDTCHYIQQYEGEWMSASGQDTIRIYLRYNRDYSAKFKNVSDQLYGWYDYKHGNIVAASNYSNRFLPMSYNADDSLSNKGAIDLWFSSRNCSNDNLYLNGSVIDPIDYQVTDVKIILNAAKTIMTWYQDNMEFEGGKPLTLPRNMILVKQP
jgi:hypothetical protein